ncbi:hypothetical protein HY417_01955, partial [Candidatus Kaiserbacteria bacterium]|nr:hypothetical protein [Candidatus Kaiserbacteria bacterium]
MWRSSRLFSTPGIAVLVVLLVGSSAYALPALADWDLNRQIDACSAEHSARAIDCWYGLINAALEHDGITGAMEVFSKIYEQQPLFASTGCHKHAHFVGDQVYYKLYRGTNDIRAIDFPQSSTACGYGIFHGFMEHLIQDNPDIPFVTEICTYLKERYSTVMGDIGTICYHGSGHGLMLAEAERVPKSGWGLVSFFTSTPARTCEALPEASSREIEECREGVYNVLVDWMEQTQYGFAYDEKNPFRICETEPRAWHQACYYEMAQKLDRVSSRDPVLLATLVSRIQDPFLRDMSFS